MNSTELPWKTECWHNEMLELISEETRPSLCSLSVSECSDNDSHAQHDPPLQNNFIVENTCQSMYEITEQHTTESANNVNQSLNNKFRKCVSLYDVSNILPLPRPVKSANTVSCETIHSQSLSSTTKSKDSGFQRSVSFVSLTSGRRNYDHVQSKVKAYIMNIKESEAVRKKNKQIHKAEVISEPASLVDEIDMVLDKEDLILKIQELKHELQEKAIYIDAQQRNYNNLLLKLAEAKNTIDSLRLQKISLNYSSSLNNSQNLSSQFRSIDFEFLEKEINKLRGKQPDLNKNLSVETNVCGQVTPVKEEQSLSLETPSSSLTEVFTPKNHSTPERNEMKSLSPVSKMFSSSLRLDKHYKPLGNLRNQKKDSNGSIHSFNNRNPSQCLTKKVRVTAVPGGPSAKLKSSGIGSSGCHKTQTSPIDLPNDNPYDRVKKWQASLPNINLLRTHSSSEGEFHENGEDELSQELVAKCNISHSASQKTKSAVSEKQSKLHIFTNNLSNITKGLRKEEKESQTVYKEQNHTVAVQSGKICCSEKRLPNSKDFFQNQNLVFPAPIDIKDSSISESESHLPKSSSLTVTVDRILKNDSDEDSSSISSSVLETTVASSTASPIERKPAFKVPRRVTNNCTHSNVVLRKPMLNVTLDSVPQINKDKFLHKCTPNATNSSKTFSYFIAESSERKAWNNRNNANFFVCKDFYFKKSSSLEDCLNLMEGMVQTGTTIIESALDRSHH